MKWIRGSALAAAATLLLGLQRFEPPAVIDLGTLGGPYAFATAINDRQQVVGQSIDAAETRVTAFLWDDGVMQDLSTDALHFDIANDINDRGQIVGNGSDANGRIVALLWDDGVLTELPVPDGSTYCSPEGINDRAHVVGWGGEPLSTRAVLLQDGVYVTLPRPGGMTRTAAESINDRGVAVGNYATMPGETRALLWPKASTHIPRRVRGEDDRGAMSASTARRCCGSA